MGTGFDVSTPAAVIRTLALMMVLRNELRKKSSLPSERHFGRFPPSLVTGHALPFGNGWM